MLPRHPELKAYLHRIDHLDIKSIEARTELRPFIAGMLSYYPWWLVLLYRTREVLVRTLGLKRHPRPAGRPSIGPRALSFTPGENALYFTVRSAREETYWVAQTPPDKHLTAFLGVVAVQLTTGSTRFHVFTAIRYQHWSGPVYFNLIRPFHHLVVRCMMKAGARCTTS